MLLTRDPVIRRSAIVGAALAAPGALRTAPAAAQGTALRKFIVPLPVPGTAWPVVTADGAHLVARQFAISVHPDLPPTTVWGYRLASGHPATPATYLGPTLVASPGTPANVTFTNGLAGPLFPADPMLIPAADPAAVRLNTHQHGGRIDDQSDGNPFVAYRPAATGGVERRHVHAHVVERPGRRVALVPRPRARDHPHERLRGPAGGYVLTDFQDNTRTAVRAQFERCSGPYGDGMIPLDIPLVIQDATSRRRARSSYPYPWAPEFFAKNVLVNGKAYPYLEVEPRKYRFRFLNGSQSRFYNLILTPRRSRCRPDRRGARVPRFAVLDLGTAGGPGTS